MRQNIFVGVKVIRMQIIKHVDIFLTFHDNPVTLVSLVSIFHASQIKLSITFAPLFLRKIDLGKQASIFECTLQRLI